MPWTHPEDASRARPGHSARAACPHAARQCAKPARNVRTYARIGDSRDTGRVDSAATLGAHIARLRRERGMSQEELAAALAVTRSIISAWENDNRVPRPAKLAALREVLGLPDAAMASPAARDRGVLPERMPVSQVLRHAADGLITQLSDDNAVDGRPGYGWRRDLEDVDQPLSAMATAYGLQAILLAGTRDWRVDLRLVREVLRRLELPEGGWSALDKSPLARPEVTAVVIGALTDAGESRDYIAERIGLLVETLDRRVVGAERARPYILTTSLLELSRLDVPEATARRFLEVLVDLAVDDDGALGWPVIVRDTRLSSSGPSTVHTAAAVRALAAWASRLRGRRPAGPWRRRGGHGWSATRCSTSTTRPCASSGPTGARSSTWSGTSPPQWCCAPSSRPGATSAAPSPARPGSRPWPTTCPRSGCGAGRRAAASSRCG